MRPHTPQIFLFGWRTGQMRKFLLETQIGRLRDFRFVWLQLTSWLATFAHMYSMAEICRKSDRLANFRALPSSINLTLNSEEDDELAHSPPGDVSEVEDDYDPAAGSGTGNSYFHSSD